MSNDIEDKKKQIIGLYGEMQLSMILHEFGWQVHRAYIDDCIDFVISKYWCNKCKKYSEKYTRYSNRNGKKAKCITNLCRFCKNTELRIISRYLQVKTSEGKPTNNYNIKKFSFHPKIKYDTGYDVFYVWIAVFEEKDIKRCYYYIFNSKDVCKFDNIKLDTYQITDNQKTELPIRNDGAVIKNSKIGYDYSIFNNQFFNNFNILEKEELNNFENK